MVTEQLSLTVARGGAGFNTAYIQDDLLFKILISEVYKFVNSLFFAL